MFSLYVINLYGQSSVCYVILLYLQDVCENLNLSEKQYEESEEVLNMQKTVLVSSKLQVKFSSKVMHISKFLSCFNLATGHLQRDIPNNSRLPIKLLHPNDAHYDDLGEHSCVVICAPKLSNLFKGKSELIIFMLCSVLFQLLYYSEQR